jgi:hypothetical protein
MVKKGGYLGMNEILKAAVKLNEKYKAVMMELDDTKNDDERIISEAKFQLDSLETSYLIDEELEAAGYKEGQIRRMKATAAKHLKAFIEKYDTPTPEPQPEPEAEEKPQDVKVTTERKFNSVRRKDITIVYVEKGGQKGYWGESDTRSGAIQMIKEANQWVRENRIKNFD